MSPSVPKPQHCWHCHNPLETNIVVGQGFCCRGCEAVYELLHQAGLQRYYTIAPDRLPPSALATDQTLERELGWLDDQIDQSGRARADVQGLHCAACVWLIEELFERQDGGVELVVNPAVGRVQFVVDPDRFDHHAFVRSVESFGYKLGPPRKRADPASKRMLWRLGISASLSMNVMLISIAFYLGLTPGSEIYSVFMGVAFGLSTLNVAVGGWPFIRSALFLMRTRTIHLDLPIALGIAATYCGSAYCYLLGDPTAAYLDSLSVFITLMLAGRFLQTRTLEVNRRQLLEAGGEEEWRAQRLVADGKGCDHVERVRVGAITQGDRLLIPPGGTTPVAATLIRPSSTQLNLSWITGESAPVEVKHAEDLLAGGINVGAIALEVCALEGWEDSELGALLRSPPVIRPGSDLPPWLVQVVRWYVPVLLGLAGLAFAAWLPFGVQRAVEVATAVLIVTCPCAFGVAAPLARELALVRLRAQGIFVRAGRFFSVAPQVRGVVFDKTGTLTLGELSLSPTGQIDRLSQDARAALSNLCRRSAHPVCVALSSALDECPISPEALPVEIVGQGMKLDRMGVQWRLGRPSFALDDPSHTGDYTSLSRNGVEVAQFTLTERMRGDLGHLFKHLRALGMSSAILSGDSPARVSALVHDLDLQTDCAVGGMRPEDKATWLREHNGAQLLMVGDGINDTPAFSAAGLAATPAIDLPGLPTRADFYFLGDNLRSVITALSWARQTDGVQRRVLRFALTYNAFAIAAALAGWVSPLTAAIIMPASSLFIISDTLLRQRGLRPEYTRP